MKKLLTTAAALVALLVAAHAHAVVSMPNYFHGEWCGEGGACPDGVMRVTPQGFTGGNNSKCLLERASYKSGTAWLLKFKCTEPGRKTERFEETWSLMDEMLVVFIQMKDRLRIVQYLPRTS
jgi:hypothetical protein